LSTDSLFLGFIITLVISMLGILTINPLFRLLGAPPDMLPMIRTFMIILYSGVPLLVVGMIGTACMRATGDTRLPSLLMVLAAVLNVALDPIFIFGLGPIPAMGLNGAATAALLARSAIFIGTVYVMRYRLDMLSFEKPDPIVMARSWRDILHVGIPAAGTNAIVPLGAVIVTAMIARYGPDAVAGFGVASRIESMMLVLYYAMSSIIGPFVGQNLAVGRERRILSALWLCTVFCVASGLVIAGSLALLSDFLPKLFSESEAVISVTKLFLWVVPVSYGTYGMVMVMNAAFNGLGQPMPAVWISVARILVLYVPLAMVGSQLYGLVGIFGAYAFANIISGIGAYIWARNTAHSLCTP
jgi:putative MATE family efflux protein